jgi:hypothetical protein
MRILVVVALCLAIVLSGCATKKADKDDDPSGTSTATGTSTKTGTGPGGGNGTSAVNRAPTASMNANNTGTAPINVTFALNGTDADGDAITWSLDFGDNGTAANGTSLPANVTHLYAAAGLYNATFAVSDGKNTTTVTLALNITGGSSFDQFVASGTPDLACPQCSVAGANTGAGYRNGINELDSWFVEIPAGAVGQPFTLDSESTDPDMVFRTSCASSGTAIGDSFVAAGPESGVVPEGALCVLAWNPEDVMAKITLTIG